MKLIESILESYPEMMEIRRDLHARPERGFDEVRTSELDAAKAAEWKIPTAVLGTAGGALFRTRSLHSAAQINLSAFKSRSHMGRSKRQDNK